MLERFAGKRTELVLTVSFIICFFLVGFYPEGTLEVFLMMTLQTDNPADFKFQARPFFALFQVFLAIILIQALKQEIKSPIILTFTFFSFALTLHLNPTLSQNLIYLFLFAGFILLCRDEVKRLKSEYDEKHQKEEG